MNKVKNRIQIFLLTFAIPIFAKCQEPLIPNDKWVNVFKSYSFDNDEGIDSLFLGWVVNNMFFDPNSAVNIYYNQQIKKIDPNLDPDYQVIVQFILQLNILAKLKSFPVNSSKLHKFKLSKFYSNNNFKQKYFATFNKYKIELFNLQSFMVVNEIDGIYTKKDFEKKLVHIKVGNQGPILICPFEFYYGTDLGQSYTFFEKIWDE